MTFLRYLCLVARQLRVSVNKNYNCNLTVILLESCCFLIYDVSVALKMDFKVPTKNDRYFKKISSRRELAQNSSLFVYC